MGIRTILVILALAGVYIIARNYLNNLKNKPRIKKSEDMIQCLYCGTHLPISEAITEGELYFCSENHKKKHEENS